MASESADSALSPAASSFVIAGKTWRLGDAIHSTGVGAVEKKNGGHFWRCLCHCKSPRSLYGRGSGHKYRVKWTNLSEELISEYGANHRVFQNPSKEQPQKVAKIHGPQPLSLDPARSRPVAPNTADVLELHPSSGEDSEPDDADPQIPAISPLQIGDNVFCLDPRDQGLISSHIAFILFL
jgi:hypothetical protein